MMSESREAVALELFRAVAFAENKRIGQSAGMTPSPDRKWILDTYVECLRAVQGVPRD